MMNHRLTTFLLTSLLVCVSTATQAAKIASECNVGLLVLTHYSPRYDDGTIIEREAKKEFSNTVLARDFMKLTLSNDGKIEIIEPET